MHPGIVPAFLSSTSNCPSFAKFPLTAPADGRSPPPFLARARTLRPDGHLHSGHSESSCKNINENCFQKCSFFSKKYQFFLFHSASFTLFPSQFYELRAHPFPRTRSPPSLPSPPRTVLLRGLFRLPPFSLVSKPNIFELTHFFHACCTMLASYFESRPELGAPLLPIGGISS